MPLPSPATKCRHTSIRDFGPIPYLRCPNPHLLFKPPLKHAFEPAPPIRRDRPRGPAHAAKRAHAAPRHNHEQTRISGSDPPRPPQGALGQITELIHVASLIHDDVVDDGTMRRGIPTINAAHGSKTAVLAGDFLLARAR